MKIRVRDLSAGELRQIAGDFQTTLPHSKRKEFEFNVKNDSKPNWQLIEVPKSFACPVFDFLASIRMTKRNGGILVETNLEIAWVSQK